jgi:hypothetical protein
MLAFIHVFSICVVAAILFVSVDEIEPNPRLALALKFLIVFGARIGITEPPPLFLYPSTGRLFPSPATDQPQASGG